MHEHPANKAVFDEKPPTRSERVGIWVAAGMATGGFLAAQTFFIVAWIVAKRLGLPVDNAGLTILNLGLSLQAAYAAPLILLAQKRQSKHAELRAEEDHARMQTIERLLRLILRVVIRIARQRGINVSEEG